MPRIQTRKTTLSALSALLLTTAAPALAQECDGIGTGGIWIGGDASGSDVSAMTEAQDQLALVLAGNAYMSLFTVSETTDVRLEAAGNGAGDPVIELYDWDGISIGFDDDSGGNSASRIETTLNPGEYCLGLTSFGGRPMTGTVRIGRLEHEPLTEGIDAGPVATGSGCGMGVSIADAPLNDVLPGSASTTAPISQIAGYDFSITEPVTISITAENEDADPVLELRTADGVLLYENDDYDGLNSRIDVLTPLAPGDYCIQLSALSDANAPVTVTVSGFDADAALIRSYDQGEAVPPLDGSYPVEDLGEIAGRVRADAQMEPGKTKWFVMEVTEGGLLLVEAIAPGEGDPELAIYDDLGRQLGYNDDVAGGFDSLVAVRVFPGTYVVALSDIQDGASLMRLVVERYVPAR